MRLMQYLEARLGHHQLPLNANAREIRELLASCALHHETTRELIQAIFKHNRCNGMNDLVHRHATVDAVVPIRLRILKSETTDLDLFHFIEAWCAAVTAFFDEHTNERTEPVQQEKKSSNEVISLSAFRHRRIKSLA